MTSDLSGRLAALSPEQLHSLADRLASRKQTQTPARTAPVLVRARPARIPLSLGQEGVWLAERLGIAGAAYCLSVPIRFHGPLNIEGLRLTIDAVIQRHEVLRTRIESTADGEGYQVVDGDHELALDVVDLSHVPAELQPVKIDEHLAAQAAKPFDFAKGPLFRACVLRLAHDEHILCWSVHHLIWDGSSTPVFVEEILKQYFAFSAGVAPPTLAPLEIQYADYSLLQREAQVSEARLDYWRRQLAQPLATLDVPTDRPRSTQLSPSDTYHFALDKPLTDSLQSMCREEGVTLYMLLLAAMQVLLARWSAQSDIIIGSPAAGRIKQTERNIGFFSTMLPIRVDVGRTLTFRELLMRVKTTCLEAFAHQGIPIERLVAELDIDRQPGRNPLYQAAFALHSFGQTPPVAHGLSLSFLRSHYATVGAEISLHLAQGVDGLSGWIEYATDLFDRSTIVGVAAQYSALLEAVVESPGQPIAELPLLSRQDRHRVLEEFNGASREYPRDRLLHQLFEAQVRRTPDALAVTFEEQRLTYRQIDAQANHLAHHLLERGIRPGSRVALCAERSAEMIVAILGIMKAGSAYVPLDPSHPTQRLQYMLEDAAAPAILVQEHLKDKLPPTSLPVIGLESVWTSFGSATDSAPALLRLSSDDLAYVMYTSGSTGEPKGVMVPHRAVTRLVINNDYVHIEPADRIAFCSNPAFDASTFEIWAGLLHGARLVIISQAVLLDVTALGSLLERERVNVLHLTTGLFNQYFIALGRIFARLKLLYFGGDAADPNIARKVLESSRPGRLIHLYGPTETTSFATWHHVETVSANARKLPIGKPIANARVYILDARGEPVPVGRIGEIHVGGEGVSHGYLNRSQLTAERFIRDPFSAQPNARMYRTGDQGRWLSDGTIEFCGRNDQQLKIRGYRVELGEVEAHLSRHPQVKEAVVIPWEDSSGEKRLVGYIVPETPAVAAASGQGTEAQREEALGRWQSLFEERYDEERAGDAPDFSGWNSSFTHRPIPLEQMQEWRDETVKRLRELHPRNVLELGCGSGLVLEHLAPRCTSYRATDFSAAAIERLRRWVGSRADLRHVALSPGTALEIPATPGGYDTIILNSVVQYFPDMEYLLAVLAHALDAVADGGRIFIGDVRHLGLLRAFHTSVQWARASDELSVRELKARIDNAIQQEKELVIDPEFFWAIAQHLPRIADIDVQIKRGAADNELTRYRYDVTLHVGPHAELSPPRWLVWNPEQEDFAGQLTTLLKLHRPPGIRIGGARNARVSRDLQLVELLESSADQLSVGELRAQVPAEAAPGVDPETVSRLAESEGFRARVTWTRETNDGSLDFGLIDNARCDCFADAGGMKTYKPHRPWRSYAHEPSLPAQPWVAALEGQVRQDLQSRLPEYMVPSAIMLLAELPLTPNGKVDRNKLPTPQFGSARTKGYQPPQGRLEQTLSELWRGALRVERVGRDDDFFELGGNSIVAIQLAARAHRLGMKFEARQVIEYRSIASLAAVVDAVDRTAPVATEAALPGRVPLTPLMRQAITTLDADFFCNNILVVRTECAHRVEPALLARALHELVAQHDALRIRLRQTQGEIELWNVGIEEVEQNELLHLVDLADEQQHATIDGISARLRSPADVNAVRMLRAVLIERGEGRAQVLLLAVHHVAYDPISLGVLLEDLSCAYELASRGRRIELSARTTPFKHWAQYLDTHALEIATREEAYWRSRLTAENCGLSVSAAGESAFFGTYRVLEKNETRELLNWAQRTCGASMEEILLTAVASAFVRHTGTRTFGVFLTRSGREARFDGIDLSRTVGWFSTEFPAILSIDPEAPLDAAAVKAIATQIAAVPNHGLGYGISRYGSAGDRLADCALPRFGLNYHGNPAAASAGLLSVAAVDTNPFPKERLAGHIERVQVIADIHEGALRMTWAGDSSILDQSAIETLAATTIEALRTLMTAEGAH